MGLASRMRLRIAGVATITSVATARLRPSAVRQSVWQTTPCKVPANCWRICCCWCGGKTSMMRSTVCAASCVQGGEDEVTGLSRSQRHLDRLQVAHLADQDDVRVLPQHALERLTE